MTCGMGLHLVYFKILNIDGFVYYFIVVYIQLFNNYHRAGAVKPALKTTLSKLQLKYLDLYLIHWPVAHKVTISFFLFKIVIIILKCTI